MSAWRNHVVAWPGPAAANPPDPYAEWGMATDFRGYVAVRDLAEDDSGQDGGRWIEVLVEANDQRAAILAIEDNLGGSVAPVYAVPGEGVTAYFTARLPLSRLPDLWRCSPIKRWELGLAVKGQHDVPQIVPTGGLLDGRAPVKGPAIAVIDHACPFLNERYQYDAGPGKAAGTRIRRLWDQSRIHSGVEPWAQSLTMGYGRILTRTQIDLVLSDRRTTAAKHGWCEDECAAYERMDHLWRDGVSGGSVYLQTHGSHVLDVAGGVCDPLTGARDKAGDADLLFVQLPMETVMDSSRGSLGVRILDGLHYLLDETEGSLLVNISYGAQAGPHDGSSLIESAIDALCDMNERLTVVVAAGNSRLASGHARVELQPGENTSLTVRVPPEDRNDSFVEFWYPAGNTGPRLRVTSPNGQVSDWVGPDGCAGLGSGASTEAMFWHGRLAAGGNGAMALLALAGANGGGATADSGDWLIEIANPQDASPLVMNAWVERDDLPRGESAEPMAFVPGDDVRARVTEACTLASLASGNRTWVIGACCASDFEMLNYSAIGPTVDGRDRPSHLAPADENSALAGLRAAATRSGDSFRMGGTSVAAAYATRSLFNRLP